MKIKNRLRLNVFLVLLMGMGFFIVQYWHQNITKEVLSKSRIFDTIMINAYRLSLFSKEIAMYRGEERPVKQWEIEYNKIKNILEDIPYSYKKESFAEWEKLEYSFERLDDLHKGFLDAIEQSRKKNLSDKFTEERTKRITSSIFAETQTIISVATILKDKNSSAYNETTAKLNLINTGAIAFITFFMFVLSFYISKKIISSLDILNKGIGNIASGDLKYKVLLEENDELGKFADSFNAMVTKLEQTMTSHEKLEDVIKERTKALENARIAAISVMEDANQQKKAAQKANSELEKEINVRKETEKELIKAKKEAEFANKSKSIFLSNMSHELRTPLNAIMGFSELLRKSPKIIEEQKKTLDIIHKSGDHLLKLINDVLDIAKIEAGKIPLENKAFDLGLLIKESLDLMSQRAEAKGLKIELDQSSSFPRYIISDPGKLRQIIINFLSNAVKYTNEGGIKVMLGTKEGMLHIEVSDSGVGIAKEDINKVFEPFVQVGGSSAKTGTGLGLAITKQFVSLFGGTVGVESELGKGSSFWAFIPYKEAKSEDVKFLAQETEKEVLGLEEGQKNTKILIVEDQAENRILLRSILEVLGLQIKEAVNGQEAVEQFQNWQPDFIWMDRRMPIMNGEEATKRIRMLPGGHKVKIVALTASAFHEERERIIKSGMDDFVAKPYRSSEIYEGMKKHLGLHYIYKEEKTSPAKESVTYSRDELEKELQKLDRELLDELYNSALLLDSEEIKAVLDKIKLKEEHLSRILAGMVDNYDYQNILNGIESIKKA